MLLTIKTKLTAPSWLPTERHLEVPETFFVMKYERKYQYIIDHVSDHGVAIRSRISGSEFPWKKQYITKETLCNIAKYRL